MTFSGTVSEYDVDEVDGTIDLHKQFEKVQDDIIKQLVQLDYDQGEILYSCERCGEFLDIVDEGKAKFRCDCTSGTQRKN